MSLSWSLVASCTTTLVFTSLLGCRSTESLDFANLSEPTARRLAAEAQIVAAEIRLSSLDGPYVRHDRTHDTEWLFKFERDTGRLIEATLREPGTDSIRDVGITDYGEFLFARDGSLWCFRCLRWQGIGKPFGLVGQVYFFEPGGAVTYHQEFATVQQLHPAVCNFGVTQWFVAWPAGFPPGPSPR